MIEGSRRRLQAVHRRDDLEVSDTNSSAGEIVAGRRLSSETGEDTTAPTTTAAQVPASSSSAVSSNEAPLEVIRLEDGTVLVERRGNFVGPPPPTPVNQPVAPAATEETVCEPMAYGGYDLQDVECQDMVPASSSSATAPPVHTAVATSASPPEGSSEEEEVYMESEASQIRALANADCRMIAAAESYADRLRTAGVAQTAAAPTGGDGRVLPAPEHGLSTEALRERARALRRRLGVHPRLQGHGLNAASCRHAALGEQA